MAPYMSPCPEEGAVLNLVADLVDEVKATLLRIVPFVNEDSSKSGKAIACYLNASFCYIVARA